MTATTEATTRCTVLVVDDMQVCREPIAELLRSRGFRAVCAADGPAALRTLDTSQIELVLLDVNMPGMDGIGVLRAIRSQLRRPDLPVLLLTELADRHTVQAAASIGVQGYLLKSEFSVDELVNRVRHLVKHCPPAEHAEPQQTSNVLTARGAAQVRPPRDASQLPARIHPQVERSPLTGALSKEKVLARIHQTLELRPVPPVLHHVASLTNDSSVSMHEIVETIRQDQALALRVLKIANSSFYTTGTRARNLLEAAGRLGMNGIRNAVVTVISIDQFAGVARSGLIPQRFWEHSLACAAIAKSLAEVKSREDGEELFLAALLHDVGRLVLGAAFPKRYKEMLESCRSTAASLDSAEREVFHVCHSEITRHVLERWNLAGPIVLSAALHEHDAVKLRGLAKESEPATIVALADRLAHAMLLGDSGDSRIFALEPLAEALSLSLPAVGKVGRETASAISDMELFYSCQGDEEFLPPLATELATAVEPRPRVVVISENAPDDALSLFFSQLGWLDGPGADVAVLYSSGKDPLQSQWSRFKQIDQANAPRCALIVLTSEEDIRAPSDWLGELPHRVEHLPAPYTQLLDAVTGLARSTPSTPNR